MNKQVKKLVFLSYNIKQFENEIIQRKIYCQAQRKCKT